MSELLPCPFCGSVRAPEVSDVGECEECSKFDDCGRRLENHTCEGCDRWERPMFVVCNYNISGCGVSGPYRRTEAEAIAAWNSRAERTCAMIPSFTKPATLDDCQEFCCSACGEYMVLQQFQGCADDVPNYCPNCGARRVGEFKPRTLEDVLRECAEAYASGADVELGSTDAMFSKYADEIRGLLGGGAR